jgi:hypothetical protein
MAAPVQNNRYPFPSGYRGYVAFSSGAYTPWNGYNNGANAPNNTFLGAVLQFVASGVPTDGQVMTLFGPDGVTYKFQFLYNSTAGSDPNAVIVRLTASGSSTAAQVMTAMLAVLSLSQAFTEGGALVRFPWVAQSINSTTSRINWTANGLFVSAVAPSNIAIVTVSQPVLGQIGIGTSRSICACAGPRSAFLPGP